MPRQGRSSDTGGSATSAHVRPQLLTARPCGNGALPSTRRIAGRAARVLGYANLYDARGEKCAEDLRRQEEEIAWECEQRGLLLLRVVHERDLRRRRPLERPALGYALGRIAAGEVSGLVVTELSRITHSVPELGGVLEWFVAHGARFVAAMPMPGVDTADAAGLLTARAIIQVSRSERVRLVERTRRGMRAARQAGPASVSDYPELSRRIAEMRGAGMTLQAIANRLNADGIPTLRGGVMWRPSSVQAAAGYQRPSTARAVNRDGGLAHPARANKTNADACPAPAEARPKPGRRSRP